MGRIDAYLKMVEGALAIGGEAQDESLADHDKRYHGGLFDPGKMKCGKREKMAKSDKGDRIAETNSMIGILRDWIPGMKVNEVSAEEAKEQLEKIDDKGVRAFVMPDEQARFEAFMDACYSGKATEASVCIIGHRPLSVLKECADMWITDRKGSITATTPLIVKGRMKVGHSDESVVGRSAGLHSHDIPLDEMKKLLIELDDPIAILPPTNDEHDKQDVLVAIVQLQERKKFPFAAVAVKVKNDPAVGGMALDILSVYGLDRMNRYAGRAALYMNEKKRQDLRRLLLRSVKDGTLPRLVHASSLQTLTEKDFSTQALGIIANSAASVNSVLDPLDKAYQQKYFAGDYAGAYKAMLDYVNALNTFVRNKDHQLILVKDKKTGKTEFRDKAGRMFKSYEFEFDDGNLKSLRDRFKIDMPHGDVAEFRKWLADGGKWKNMPEKAREFWEFYRTQKLDDGNVAGWYDRNSGDVTFVSGRTTPTTVAHEIGWHATFHWAEKHHPELYKKLVRYAEEAPDGIKESVKAKYGKNLTAKELLDEIGAERFTKEDISPLLEEAQKRASEHFVDGVEERQDEMRKAFVRGSRALSDEELDAIAELDPKAAVEKLVQLMLEGRALGVGRKGNTRVSKAKRYLRMARRDE